MLTGPVTTLGRGSDADIVLDDTGVSRRHAELRVDTSSGRTVLSVLDLGSTNGTFVADEPALLFGVLLVLLTPCIDYVIVFSGLAGGASDRLLAAGKGAAVRRMFAGLKLPPEVMETYANQVAEPGAATAMLNWYRAARRPGPGMPDLSRVIEVPTMVVWGEDDVALDLRCLNGTERYVRDLAVHRLPGVSHWVQQDAPDQVNRLLQAFLPRS